MKRITGKQVASALGWHYHNRPRESRRVMCDAAAETLNALAAACSYESAHRLLRESRDMLEAAEFKEFENALVAQDVRERIAIELGEWNAVESDALSRAGGDENTEGADQSVRAPYGSQPDGGYARDRSKISANTRVGEAQPTEAAEPRRSDVPSGDAQAEPNGIALTHPPLQPPAPPGQRWTDRHHGEAFKLVRDSQASYQAMRSAPGGNDGDQQANENLDDICDRIAKIAPLFAPSAPPPAAEAIEALCNELLLDAAMNEEIPVKTHLHNTARIERHAAAILRRHFPARREVTREEIVAAVRRARVAPGASMKSYADKENDAIADAVLAAIGAEGKA